MSDRLRFVGTGVLLLCTLTLAVPIGSVTHKYIEDFTTKQYCDTLNTTALWDTAAGELKLPPFVPTLVGSYATTNSAEGVALAGDYAFVAISYDGLAVIDISDPTSPSLAGSAGTPGSGQCYAVSVSGDYAYLAGYSEGLVAFDISDPTSPSHAGTYDTPGSAYFVTVSGNYAFVADQNSGLQVIDISDPTSPTLAGSYDTPGEARGVYVSGDHAYVADRTSGLQVIDISDPTSPTLAGSYDTPGEAWNVAIDGDHAYVADRTSGLQVIDISDPTSPTLAGGYDTPGDARGVFVAGDYVYLGDFASGLLVINVSDPSNPSYMYGYDTLGSARDVVVAGEHAYVADRSPGLQVIDISDPAGPGYAGSDFIYSEDVDVVLAGDHAYVANFNAGLRVIDISDPTSPTALGNFVIPSPSLGVAVAGDYAYVAAGNASLQVVDISNPSSPTLAGNVSLPGLSYQVAIAGNYAYVADEGAGVEVVDIADPTSPAWVGSYDTPGHAFDVDIAGDYAFVADRLPGLYVLDISTPTSPKLAGYYDTPYMSVGVAVEGDYAYVAEYDSGLVVIDISDPTNPVFAGTYVTSYRAYKVAIAGDYAYVATGPSGLQVIDISDPTTPILAGSFDTPGISQGVAIAGDYAYVADGSSGVQVTQVFERSMLLDDNIGQSLVLNSPIGTVSWVKLSSSQNGIIQWEVSADNGANWQWLLPDAQWHLLDYPGLNLRWRATQLYSYELPTVNPTCSTLNIAWLYNFAFIDSIVDIPNDQGRQVRISWSRSSDDYSGSPLPITEYAVYRKIDYDLSQSPKLVGKDDLFSIDDQLTLPAYPPGDWDYLMSIPADCEDIYNAVVPTLADSTIADGMYYSSFFVRARTATPGRHYDSPPDSGYSVDNLAPGVPLGFVVSYNTGSGNQLTWDPSNDEDFDYFRVYRGTSADFTPEPGNLVQATVDPNWLDGVSQGWQYYYKITAIDFSGNESDAASAGSASGADITETPQAFALHQNLPNPFNPVTTIGFDIPEKASVKLSIYDVSGRLIRTLVDQEMEPGRKSIRWNGKDTEGREIASGVYFYRLETPTFNQSKKMILLR
jgi:hypothetical protein